MSDASQIQKEIEYWSVLIQKHKEAKKPKTLERNTNKYLWKRSTSYWNPERSQNTGSTPSPAGLNLAIQNTRKKQHYRSANFSKTSTRLANTAQQGPTAGKTGTVFNSKFKWTKKTSQNGTNLIQNPASTSKKPDLEVKISPIGNPASVACPTAVPAVSQGSKVFVPEMVKHKDHTQIKDDKPIAESNYRYPSQNVQKRMPGRSSSRSILQTSHPNVAKWKPSSSFYWQHGKRRHSRTKRVNDSRTSWTMGPRFHQKNSNPYKLNRTSRQLDAGNKSRNPYISKYRIRNNKNRVLDRRQKGPINECLNKALLEGIHLKKHTSTVKQLLANRVVVRSHQATRYKKQEKKRQHCLYFGRFGKCMRGDDCKFIHDPSRIAVCTRFLRGTCRDENCSFSHKLEKEKTPVCLYFLRGKCSQANCPYLHVYLGKDAAVCEKFAKSGYCPNADKCKMQHIKCCPEFYGTGICPRDNECKLPHMEKKTHSMRTKAPKRRRTKSLEKENIVLKPASENK